MLIQQNFSRKFFPNKEKYLFKKLFLKNALKFNTTIDIIQCNSLVFLPYISWCNFILVFETKAAFTNSFIDSIRKTRAYEYLLERGYVVIPLLPFSFYFF